MRSKSLQSRYAQLESMRQAPLDRARACAQLTIPALLPKEGHNETQYIPSPYQSVGARGVNNLASRLLMALFPPNAPFFKLAVDDNTAAELTGNEDLRGEIEEAFGSIERTVVSALETGNMRVAAFEAIKHLIIAGNVLFVLKPNNGAKVVRLDRYVVKRDASGNPLEVLVKESIAPIALPPEARAIYESENKPGDKGDEAANSVDLYTGVMRRADKWEIWQEIKGRAIPGTKGSFPLDECPYMPLRLMSVDGEDYGRSYVEEYYGDLQSLEGLSRAILEAAIAASKLLFLVKPNSTTRAKTLAEAPNGAFREGNPDDVGVLQMQKYNDFRVAQEQAANIERRMEYAFLLNSSFQRDGERVTAEEIRRMAEDLEVAIGSIYATQALEWQLPLVSLVMRRLERTSKIPALPKGVVRPMIVTGVEALGRGNDRQRLLGLIQDASMLPSLMSRIDEDELLKRLGASWQVDMKGLIKSPEQIAQEQQQAMMQQMAMQVAPNVVNQAGQMLGKRVPQAAEEAPAAPPAQ